MARAGDAVGQQHFALAASYAAFLRSSSSSLTLTEPEWLSANSRSFAALGGGLVAELARVLEAHLFLAFGESTRALDRAEEAERFRPTLGGYPPVTEIPLGRGLAAAKCCLPALAQEQSAPLLATLDHAIKSFRRFSEGCAENFLHKLRLLEAEHARLHGKTDETMAKYEEAEELGVVNEKRWINDRFQRKLDSCPAQSCVMKVPVPSTRISSATAIPMSCPTGTPSGA